MEQRFKYIGARLTAVLLAWGEGEAPTALLAFHQLIVKHTAVAEVRDHGESDGFKTKKLLCNVE